MTSWFARWRNPLRRADRAVEDEPRPDYRVLFVCMGNICRSPSVEGVFREIVSRELPDLRIEIDSAGTHDYHVGKPPDPRAQRAAQRRGVDLSALRARRVTAEDFERFDLVIAMDPLNVVALEEICPPEQRSRIRLLLEFAPEAGRTDVPDPYYGGSNGFEYVLDLAEQASKGLLIHLRTVLSRGNPV
jgi:protein-tyrosine phosphatase